MVHGVVVAMISRLEVKTTSGKMDAGGYGVAVEWMGFQMDRIGAFCMQHANVKHGQAPGH